MSKNSLHRHYDKLAPEERFKLDLLATARGDAEESERLVRTCNRQTYTMNDRRFTGRWTGAHDMTLRVYGAMENSLAKLDMVDALRELVPYPQRLSASVAEEAYLDGHKAGSHHSWTHAGKTGDPPAWPSEGPDGELIAPDEDERDPAMERDLREIEARLEQYGGFLPDVLDHFERNLAARAFGLWEGFAAFCRESVGVAPEEVIAAVLEPVGAPSGVADRVEDLKARAERLGLEADAGVVEEVREGLAETWRLVEARGV